MLKEKYMKLENIIINIRYKVKDSITNWVDSPVPGILNEESLESIPYY